MIKENKETNLPIYSATATVDDDILIAEAEKKLGRKIETGKFLDKINRTILSDKKLAEALSKELSNRGISPGDHIALVAEWDTDYGRLLPQIFKEVFQKDFFHNEVNERVHRFSYLRGIDGKLPGEQNGSAREQKKNDGSDIKKLEEPLGKSQYDYLRRLAERIGRRNDQLKREDRGAIKAIGVLGNDFYDKFLILQALGQRFPDRIFFTTDLDARYLHPANIEWTRNLVVASSFGLQLHEDLQGEVPPFRDSYQTSVFWATLYAFFSANDDAKLSPMSRALRQKTWPSPHIFEIGRHNAIDLTARNNDNADYVPVNQTLAVQGFPDIGWQSFLVIIVFLSILGILLWLSCNWDPDRIRLWEITKKFLTNRLIISCLVSILLIILIIFFFNRYILNDPSEEPLNLTEGISIWPTEFIRLFAVALSFVLFILSLDMLKKNKHNIIKDFSLFYKSPIELNNNTSVNAEWWNYLRRTKNKRHHFLIFILALVYFSLCFYIIVCFGTPTAPVRGYKSRWINYSILFVNVVSFLFLTFFILDTIILCQRFIAQFYVRQPHWESYSLDYFVEKWIKGPDPSKWIGSKAEAALSDWMLIQLIARRTDVVGKLIFFPFIIWFLMFVSRLYYFDNWRTPLGLAIVISLGPLLAWSCAVYLRHSAEKLRAVVVSRLAQQLIGAYATEPSSKADADRIQYVLNEVKAIKRGAFASYLQQPVVQSLLVPVGGISGVKLLEFLAKLG